MKNHFFDYYLQINVNYREKLNAITVIRGLLLNLRKDKASSYNKLFMTTALYEFLFNLNTL